MDHLSQVFFNLLLNSSCSFFAGLLLVLLALWIFRVNDSGWRLLLLSLPFVKILWDLLYRRIPIHSILRTSIDPLSLPPKHQTLTIGAGFSEYGPTFNFLLTAQTQDGKSYSTSLADYLFFGIVRKFGPPTLHVILGAILGISMFLVVRRVYAAVRFEFARRKYRNDDQALTRIKLWLREVDLYVSAHYSGTPFTGGFFKPYVCIPTDAQAKLSDEERNAVIQHEIAHVRHCDLWVTFAIKALGDFLWFIPGYRWLSQKIDRLRELLADRTAVRLGASEGHLASALLKLKEIPEDNSQVVLYSAFFREKSLLKRRVEALTGHSNTPAPRFGWNNWLVRVLVTAWTTSGVMLATFAGNHDDIAHEIPAWAERIFRKLGWM